MICGLKLFRRGVAELLFFCLVVLMERDAAKILVVTGTGLSSGLAGYALKAARRLDLDIILLFVARGRASLSVGQRKKLVEKFMQSIDEEAASFTSLAWKTSVRVTVVVDVGERDEVIARIRAQEPTIRFIFSEDVSGCTNKVGNPVLPQITVVEHP